MRISDWSSDVCSSDLEDQGRVSIQFRLPAGATQERTLEVRDAVENYMLTAEKNNVQALFLVAGGGGGGAAGQNTGQGYVNLVDWDDRPGPDNTADAIAQRARGALSGLGDAQIFARSEERREGQAWVRPGSSRGVQDN